VELDATRAELEAEAARNRQAELAAVLNQKDTDLAAREAELERQFRGPPGAGRNHDPPARRDRNPAACPPRPGRDRGPRPLEIAEDAKPKSWAKTSEPPANKAIDTGVSTKDKARILIAERPGITGAELGRALNVTDRYGRQRLAQLLEEPPQEPEPRGSGAVLRAVN
jgi:hypothetical protein